jgi:hypothetical protein
VCDFLLNRIRFVVQLVHGKAAIASPSSPSDPNNNNNKNESNDNVMHDAHSDLASLSRCRRATLRDDRIGARFAAAAAQRHQVDDQVETE